MTVDASMDTDPVPFPNCSQLNYCISPILIVNSTYFKLTGTQQSNFAATFDSMQPLQSNMQEDAYSRVSTSVESIIRIDQAKSPIAKPRAVNISAQHKAATIIQAYVKGRIAREICTLQKERTVSLLHQTTLKTEDNWVTFKILKLFRDNTVRGFQSSDIIITAYSHSTDQHIKPKKIPSLLINSTNQWTQLLDTVRYTCHYFNHSIADVMICPRYYGTMLIPKTRFTWTWRNRRSVSRKDTRR